MDCVQCFSYLFTYYFFHISSAGRTDGQTDRQIIIIIIIVIIIIVFVVVIATKTYKTSVGFTLKLFSKIFNLYFCKMTKCK